MFLLFYLNLIHNRFWIVFDIGDLMLCFLNDNLLKLETIKKNYKIWGFCSIVYTYYLLSQR